MNVEPVKTSLVHDLVTLINANLGVLLQVRVVACPNCKGRGTIRNFATNDDAPCETCGGIGAIEHYDIDREQLRQPTFGRLIEQIEYKNGQYVPKFRSKDKAFTQLVRMLGFEKAIVEIANASPLAQTLSDAERASFVQQLKELAAIGGLDGR